MTEAPLPPEHLMRQVAAPPEGADLGAFFLERGRAQRVRMEAALPGGWSWEGRRVLDFGCGAGRMLRHFLPEARAAEFWGCDINGPAIGWLRETLSPPLRLFEVTEGRTELPVPDGHFDLIWGNSVFSHVFRDWAEWLLELRRVLTDDGYLMLTFLGPGWVDLWHEVAGGADWDPDQLGMAAFRQDAPWDHGGPIVFISDWWLRAHWGRAFEVERIDSAELGERRQSLAILRKRPGTFTPADLERPEADEPRELAAALWERDRLRRELDDAYASRSWRVTRPLRRAAGRLGL